jgi:hypothetical protein
MLFQTTSLANIVRNSNRSKRYERREGRRFLLNMLNQTLKKNSKKELGIGADRGIGNIKMPPLPPVLVDRR